MTDCVYLGDLIGFAQCGSCKGRVRLKVFQCDIHGSCTLAKPVPGIRCCAECPDYARAEGARRVIRSQRRVGRAYVWPKPGPCDVLFVLPATSGSHWAHRYGPTACAVVARAGVRARYVQGVRRLSDLDPVLTLCMPRVVVNHAAVLGADTVRDLSNRGIVVVTLIHSCLADIATNASLMNRLAAYEEHSVCATPSARIADCMGWLHIPNPIPGLRAREKWNKQTPMKVGVLCRSAVVKNMLRQCLAVAAAGHVPVVLESCAHVARYLSARGVRVETWPAMPWHRFVRRIRTELDAVMQVSLEESFGYVAIEAALQGIPSIVSDCMELSAFTAPPHSVEDMAAALRTIDARYDVACDVSRQSAERLMRRNNSEFARVIGSLINPVEPADGEAAATAQTPPGTSA